MSVLIRWVLIEVLKRVLDLLKTIVERMLEEIKTPPASTEGDECEERG